MGRSRLSRVCRFAPDPRISLARIRAPGRAPRPCGAPPRSLNTALRLIRHSAPIRYSHRSVVRGPVVWSGVVMAERILIVDDDPVQRRLLENMATRAGYEVLIAEGGDAAVALLA